MRLFIAIELPGDIIKKLGSLQDRLKKDCKAKVSWSKPENIHLTLKFLGNANEETIDAIKKAIENACLGIKPFTLIAEGIGSFPNLDNLRVIWIGIKEKHIPIFPSTCMKGQGEGRTPLLNSIYERLEIGLNKIGFEKEKRGFQPHLTLGRVKYDDKAGLKAAVEKSKDIKIGEFNVNGIVLFKSELNPKGAVYTKVFECKLK